MNEMDENKISLSKFSKLNAPRRKGLSLQRRQNGISNHVPWGLEGH
jgi:hypothetical protein